MKTHRVFLAAGLMLVASSTTVPARDSAWTVRAHGAIVESSAADRTSVDSGLVGTVDAGGGFGIGVEYRLSDRFGLEFSALSAGLEIGGSVSSRAPAIESFELSMMPLTVAVPFHFDVGGRADLFVGPTFSIVRYVDIRWQAGAAGVDGSIDVDSDAAPGAMFGVELPLGKRGWAFSAGLRYMKTSAGGTRVDPMIVMLGFAYRF